MRKSPHGRARIGKGIRICLATLEPHRSLSVHYLVGFGGGLGFGTPVVSYAPLPMLNDMVSLVIIVAIRMRFGKGSGCLLAGCSEESVVKKMIHLEEATVII